MPCLYSHNCSLTMRSVEIALGYILPHTKLWHQTILYVCFCSPFPVSAYVIHIRSRQAIETFACLSLLFSNLHKKNNLANLQWKVSCFSNFYYNISISVIGIELVHFYLKALTETGMN